MKEFLKVASIALLSCVFVITFVTVFAAMAEADYRHTGVCRAGGHPRIVVLLRLTYLQKLGCYLGETVESN